MVIFPFAGEAEGADERPRGSRERAGLDEAARSRPPHPSLAAGPGRFVRLQGTTSSVRVEGRICVYWN